MSELQSLVEQAQEHKILELVDDGGPIAFMVSPDFYRESMLFWGNLRQLLDEHGAVNIVEKGQTVAVLTTPNRYAARCPPAYREIIRDGKGRLLGTRDTNEPPQSWQPPADTKAMSQGAPATDRGSEEECGAQMAAMAMKS